MTKPPCFSSQRPSRNNLQAPITVVAATPLHHCFTPMQQRGFVDSVAFARGRASRGHGGREPIRSWSKMAGFWSLAQALDHHPLVRDSMVIPGCGLHKASVNVPTYLSIFGDPELTSSVKYQLPDLRSGIVTACLQWTVSFTLEVGRRCLLFITSSSSAIETAIDSPCGDEGTVPWARLSTLTLLSYSLDLQFAANQKESPLP